MLSSSAVHLIGMIAFVGGVDAFEDVSRGRTLCNGL